MRRFLICLALLLYGALALGQVHTYCPLDLACTWTALETFAGGLTVSGAAADFSGSTISKLRIATGLTTSTNGDWGYDSTGANWHGWNGADAIAAMIPSGFSSGDCPQPTQTSGKWVLADSGAPCRTSLTINVNGSGVSSPNFNGTTPAAPTGGLNCTWQVSGSSVSCYTSPLPAILAYGSSYISSGSTFSSASPVAIVSPTLTAPSSGCPCRLVITQRVYYYWTSGGTNGIESWITDGTNVWAANSASNYNCNGSPYCSVGATEASPVRYANGAAPTITLNLEAGFSGNYVTAGSYSGVKTGFSYAWEASN